MIGIVDYGLSNISSVLNAVKRLDYNCETIVDPKKLNNVDKIILPGVGSFKKATINLKKLNLFESLKNFILIKKKPFLGICLGMQLLYDHSSEDGGAYGLGVLGGKVKQLIPTKEFKVPNVGWREIEIIKQGNLINQLDEKPIFYFVHKYACYSERKTNTIAELNYTNKFDCIVEKTIFLLLNFTLKKVKRSG